MNRPLRRLRTLLAGLTLAVIFIAPAPAKADGWLEQAIAKERAIKAMPIERRPNRLGHVYGNNYRRAYYGRVFVNAGRYPQPLKRFFTIP